MGDARSQMVARTNTAATDSKRMIGLVGAEQTNFSRLLGDYERNPALVTSLLQAETFKRVWANAQFTSVLPDLTNSSMRFHLGEPLTPLTLSTNQNNP